MILKCKMCGGDIELTDDKTLATCAYCGNVMTIPKINNDQKAALFNRGNQFRRNGEFDKALGVYENILREDDSDAEAHWCCALCRFGIEYVEDPSTYEWIPTCHRASFDSILEDVDYLAAVEHSDGVTKKQYQKEAIRIANVQKNILATSQNEEPFDVFICYKESDENGDRTVDSTLAQDIYYQLTDAGFRVFFSRITLEDKVGSEYEPYIFAALNSAKVMIVVGTKPEYYNAVWVKNEWSRYLAMMRKDRTKLLLPCYRGMDPYDMPEALSILQSYDMSKIGFIQDLVRGVRKVVQTEPDKVTQKNPANTQNTAMEYAAVNHAAAKIKRGNIALQDKDWEQASRFFEEALDADPEMAEAYLGEFLADEKCSTMKDLVRIYISKYEHADSETFTLMPQYDNYNEHIEKQAQEKSVVGYLSEKEIREKYPASLESEQESMETDLKMRVTQLNKIQDKLKSNRLLNHARQYATGTLLQEIDQMIAQICDVQQNRYEKSQHIYTERQKEINEKFAKNIQEIDAAVDEKYQEAKRHLEKLDKQYEMEYEKIDKQMKVADSIEQYEAILARLRPLATAKYKDSSMRMGTCNQQLDKLRREEKLRENEETYQRCLQQMKEPMTYEQYKKVRYELLDLGDYKDAKTQAETCRNNLDVIEKEQTTIKVAIGVVAFVAMASLMALCACIPTFM